MHQDLHEHLLEMKIKLDASVEKIVICSTDHIIRILEKLRRIFENIKTSLSWYAKLNIDFR
jgi:hypothetical protein